VDYILDTDLFCDTMYFNEPYNIWKHLSSSKLILYSAVSNLDEKIIQFLLENSMKLSLQLTILH